MVAGNTAAASALHQPQFWTLDRISDALGGGPRGSAELSRICTDTRAITPNCCFVALKGESFDAHDFLADAVAAGAKALIVSDVKRAANLGVPAFEVSDTTIALGTLARYRRRAWGKTVVGVVGTNGKTSTKELLKAALGSRYHVHATTGNYNNLIGAPQTLLALPDEADIAVIEMGTNHPGEVEALRVIVEPDIVVITSIAEEHLEGLGDLAGVLREEVSACSKDSVAVAPASQPEIGEAALPRSKRVVVAGLDSGDVKADRWGIEADGTSWFERNGTTVRVPLRGVHNLRNAMLAVAVALEAGVSDEDVARGIAAMEAPPMRVNFQNVGSVTIINDAYNSNPGSARAALELLEHAGKGRQRVAIVGSMLELGPTTDQLHDDVARTALGHDIELLVGVGQFADALKRVAPGDERHVGGAEPADAWNAISARVNKDAVILLKGSRGVRLERLVPLITEWASG